MARRHKVRPQKWVRHPAMTAVSIILAALCVLGVATRYLPVSVQALTGMPIIISVGPWYGLLGIVGLALAILGHSMRAGVANAVAIAFLLVGVGGAVWYGGMRTQAPEEASLRVMSLNTHKGMADAAQVVQVVRDESVDILCLQEVTAQFEQDLVAEGLGQILPYHAGSVPGEQVWTSMQATRCVDDAAGYSGAAMAAATVELSAGTSVRFVSVHTCSPIPGYEGLWLESLARVRDMGAVDMGFAEGDRYILAGDFNATVEHRAFRDVLAAGFEDADSLAGEGIGLTWPSGAPLGGLITIDHVLLSQGFVAGGFLHVAIDGSDHRAVICDIWEDDLASIVDKSLRQDLGYEEGQ